MEPRFITVGLIVFVILLLALAAILIFRGSSEKEIEARVMAATRGRLTDEPEVETPTLGVLRVLFWIGGTIRARTRMYSERDILVLEGMIAGSGMRPAVLVPVILGLKSVLMILVPLLGFLYARLAGFSSTQQYIVLCVCIPLGMLGPEWVLTWLRRRYMASLRRGIPDALDLLVVCSEAGMALESALEHVSQEIRHSNVPVSVGLEKLLDELLVLPDRREAFRNFGERTGIEGARRLATMLSHSLQYGTPLSQVLRTIAVDLRRDRMLALETKAARLPVLLVLPLILFIMPSMFIVMAGPAALKLTDTLHSVTASMGQHRQTEAR